jgi:UDP-glucose:(heptosyl)LPS alpha-1,3-glucosyltransferase
MKIGLVRRGFSRTGGAESYLKRFGVHFGSRTPDDSLYSTQDWPRPWLYGNLVRLNRRPLRFAQAVQERRQPDELLFSLDRVLRCDCYRAGWTAQIVARTQGPA